MQNPVTGSGGMLIGRVREIGAEHPAHGSLKAGRPHRHAGEPHADAAGHRRGPRPCSPASTAWTCAATPSSSPRGIYAKLPDGPAGHAGAGGAGCLRRAGAGGALREAGDDGGGAGRGQERRALPRPGAAADWAGQGQAPRARHLRAGARRAEGHRACATWPLKVDATQAVDVMAAGVRARTDGAALRPGGELRLGAEHGDGDASSACGTAGTVIFFSMATSFTAAALGAEGVGKDVTHDRRQWLRAGPRGAHAGAAPAEPALRRSSSSATRYLIGHRGEQPLLRSWRSVSQRPVQPHAAGAGATSRLVGPIAVEQQEAETARCSGLGSLACLARSSTTRRSRARGSWRTRSPTPSSTSSTATPPSPSSARCCASSASPARAPGACRWPT